MRSFTFSPKSADRVLHRLLLLALLALPAMAAGVLTTDAKTYTDRAEIVLTLNVPWKGEHAVSTQGNDLFILFDGIVTPAANEVSGSNEWFTFARLYPDGGDTLLQIRMRRPLAPRFTQNGEQLRIRLLPAGSAVAETSSSPAAVIPGDENALGSAIPKMDERYLVVVGFIGVMLLIWLLVKIFKGRGLTLGSGDGLQVITQKIIDSKNRVVLIRYRKMNYLVLLGTTNMLIDQYPDGEARQFDKVLDRNRKTIRAYMNQKDNLETYKQKAERS